MIMDIIEKYEEEYNKLSDKCNECFNTYKDCLPDYENNCLAKSRLDVVSEILDRLHSLQKQSDKAYELPNVEVTDYDREIIRKIEHNIELTTEEKTYCIFEKDIDEIEGDRQRWGSHTETIFAIGDRTFLIEWFRGATEYQDNEYCNEPFEVERVSQLKVIQNWVGK